MTLEKDAAALPLATMRLKAAGDEGRRLRHEGLLMALNLMEMAQARWRRLDGVHLLPLVRAGILFVDGVRHGTKLAGTRGPHDATVLHPPITHFPCGTRSGSTATSARPTPRGASGSRAKRSTGS